MINSSLASLKKKFGITDDVFVKYEQKKKEIILRIPLKVRYDTNEEIVQNAENLVRDKNERDWAREDFFADLVKVRDKVFNDVFAESEIEETILDSFKRELEVAKFKIDRYTKACKNFEKKYKMTSTEFFSKFERGELNEEDDFFDWYSAYRGIDIWNKKYKILEGFSL